MGKIVVDGYVIDSVMYFYVVFYIFEMGQVFNGLSRWYVNVVCGGNGCQCIYVIVIVLKCLMDLVLWLFFENYVEVVVIVQVCDFLVKVVFSVELFDF